MPLDHYISQVYLRKFLAPELHNRMYAMRKSDLASFTPRTSDVCRIEDGNTNQYLSEERAIEEFLTEVEPRYNAAVERFADDVPNPEHIYAVAGIIAYFMICSPGGMRINSGPLRAMVETAARDMDQQEDIPAPHEFLGDETLADLIADGRVEIQIDPHYPAAIGIADILGRVSLFGNSRWDIITNSNVGCEFFTSDYPVAIEPTPDARIISRLVPLSPNIAVRIIPDMAYAGRDPNFEFPGFRYCKFEIDAREARRLNRLLVRCAEDTVFAADWNDWRPRFIENHRHYRLNNITENFVTGHGELMHHRIEIVAHTRS